MAGGSDPAAAAQADTINNVLAFALICIFIGAAFRFLYHFVKRRLPYTVLFFLFGVALSAWTRHGYVGGLDNPFEAAKHAHPHLILFILVPPLLYESAFNMNFHVFRRVYKASLLLALPGVLIALALTALFLHGLSMWDDWALSFAVGSILSATDPVAVVAALHELGAPEKLSVVIEGESLLNDGSAFVAFLIFQNVSAGDGEDAPGTIEFAARLALGGPAWGILCYFVAIAWLTLTHNDPLVEISIHTIGVYATFFIAEHELHVSGVLAVVTMGVLMAARGKYATSPEVQESQRTMLEQISFYSNTILFVLAGVVVYPRINNEVAQDPVMWGYLFALYAMLHVIRAFIIFLFSQLLAKWGDGMTWKEGTIIVYGGLRGAIALALVLILEEGGNLSETEINRTSFLVSGIVVLTLLVNGTTTNALYKRLNLYPPNQYRKVLFDRALRVLEDDLMPRHQEEMQIDWFFSHADWPCVEAIVPALTSVTIDEDGNLSVPRSVRRTTPASVFAHFFEEALSRNQNNMSSSDIEMDEIDPRTLNRTAPARMQSALVAKLPASSPLVLGRKLSAQTAASDASIFDTVGVPLGAAGIMHRTPTIMSAGGIRSALNEHVLRQRSTSIITGEQERSGVTAHSRAEEISHTLVSAVLASYHTQYERHAISDDALVHLIEAAERALDYWIPTAETRTLHPKPKRGSAEISHVFELEWKALRKSLPWPVWELAQRSVNTWYGGLARWYIQADVYDTVEALSGFIRAHTLICTAEFGTHLHDIIHRDAVMATIKSLIEEAKTVLLAVHSNFPGFALIAHTVLTARAALRAKREALVHLHGEGLLRKSDVEALSSVVDYHMQSLDWAKHNYFIANSAHDQVLARELQVKSDDDEEAIIADENANEAGSADEDEAKLPEDSATADTPEPRGVSDDHEMVTIDDEI